MITSDVHILNQIFGGITAHIVSIQGQTIKRNIRKTKQNAYVLWQSLTSRFRPKHANLQTQDLAWWDTSVTRGDKGHGLVTDNLSTSSEISHQQRTGDEANRNYRNRLQTDLASWPMKSARRRHDALTPINPRRAICNTWLSTTDINRTIHYLHDNKQTVYIYLTTCWPKWRSCRVFYPIASKCHCIVFVFVACTKFKKPFEHPKMPPGAPKPLAAVTSESTTDLRPNG